MKAAQRRTLVRRKSTASQPRKLPWYILALIIFQAFAAFLTETRFLPLKHNVGAFEVGAVVFFIVVAGYFAQHKIHLRFHRSVLPLFLLTIAAGLSNFNIMSDPSAYVVFRVLSCTILVISCLMLVVWYNVFIFDESTLELFLRAITLSAAIITVWVLLDQIAHGGTIGASGPFRNRAHSGIYLHTALWLVLIRANWPKGVRWDRWLTYPVVAMILYVISTSGRRSIYISVACGFILLAVVTLFTGSARTRFRIGALMLVSVGALGIVYFKLSDFWRPAEFFKERVSMVDDRISTFSGLEEESEDTFVIQQRMAGIRAFKEHPILGIGYGGFAKYDGNPTGHEMHSTPTRFLAETGILGLSLYLWWMGEIFWMGFRVWWGNRKGPFGPVSLIMLVALTSVSISSIYNRQMTDRSFWLLLVFCIGLEAWSRRSAVANQAKRIPRRRVFYPVGTRPSSGIQTR